MSYSYLESIYSLSDDTYEDNLSWCFAVAEVLYYRVPESTVPAEMEFTASPYVDEPSGDWPTCEVLEGFDGGCFTVEELETFGRYINDKDNAYRAAGAQL